MPQVERRASLERKTLETSVEISLNIDGLGTCNLATGVACLDHLLLSFARHGLIDLQVTVAGDGQIHHTIENVAILLGGVMRRAFGDDVQDTRRVACEYMVQDESLARAIVDIGPIQSYCFTDLYITKEDVEGVPKEMFAHFIRSFTTQARMNVHCAVLYGSDDHHKIEAVFKALGRALHSASRPDQKRLSVQEEYLESPT